MEKERKEGRKIQIDMHKGGVSSEKERKYI
jgi:hypothetical protein